MVNDTSYLVCGYDYICGCGDLCAAYWASNEPLNGWNTSAVTTMYHMFQDASSFDQSIGSWNTGAVTDMAYMFNGASSFDQSIESWNTGAVTQMTRMFHYACMMKVKNLPTGMTSASTNLDSYLACPNCPPGGGECLNGFKRSDSEFCDVCPLDATNLNGSCITCPSDPYLTAILAFLALFVIFVAATLAYAFRDRLANFISDFDLKNTILSKQVRDCEERSDEMRRYNIRSASSLRS